MFKKTSLALAVAGLAFAGQSIAAPSVNVSGFVDLGVESYSETDLGTDIFAGLGSPQANTDKKALSMNNPVNSRLIVSGGEDLGNGWTSSYHIETAIDVLDDDAGNGTAAVTTRQANISISKGKNTITVGSQWSPLFEYSAWNTMKTEGHGYGAYYYTTERLTGSMQYGFRNDSTINYTYGGGGYSTDPVTFTVAAHINESNEVTNEEGITGITAGGAASFGQFTINAAYVQAMATDTAEPSIMSIGGKFRANEQLEVGFTYQLADSDLGNAAGDERSYVSVGGMYQVAPDLSVHAGFATGEDDDETERQMDSDIYAQVWKNVTDTFSIRGEFEMIDYGDAGDASVVAVYLRQAF